MLRDILDEMAAGTLGGTVYEINLANEGLVIEYNDAYDLSADAKALADQAIADIISGAIEPTG